MPVSKLAFVYPGQGSQRVAMGTELQKQCPALFERFLGLADEVSGRPISRYSVDGSIEDLTQTEVTQPALVALCLALTEHARAVGLRPDYVAGHSLGEFTAAVAAGALTFAEGLRLVCERARAMARIQAEHPGAMAMISGLTAEQVEELCVAAQAAGPVYLANLNAPLQNVVSGLEAGVKRVVALAEQSGAEETLILWVGVASHTAFMQPVQERLRALMADIKWTDPQVPVVSNASGEVLRTADEVHNALVDQITQPVQWVACVRRLLDEGCGTFVQLAPGRVLNGLIRQIAAGVDTFASASPRRISVFAEERLAGAPVSPASAASADPESVPRL